MPTTSIPPWLIPADPAQHYARGIALGLQGSQQQAEQAIAQQRIAAAQAQAQQEMLVSQQRMAVQQQLAEQEAALKGQELGMEQEAIAAKIEEAGRREAAQREYQSRVAGGEDPMNVLLEMGPLMGSQQTAEAAVIRARMQAEKEKTVLPPQRFDLGQGLGGVWNPQTGAFQLTLPKGQMTEYQRRTLVDRASKQLETLSQANPDLALEAPDKSWSDRRKAAYLSGRKTVDSLQKRIDELESGDGYSGMEEEGLGGEGQINIGAMGLGPNVPAAPGPAPALRLGRVSIGGLGQAGPALAGPGWPAQETRTGQVLPMPKDKSQAVAGQVYQTRLGPMEWDGQKFVLPQ